MSGFGSSDRLDNNEKLEKQPPDLYLMLRSLSLALRLSSLYTAIHPSTVAAISSLVYVIEEYLLGLKDRSITCVFTTDTIIVNDRTYKGTFESNNLFSRLRARGVMAITFIQGITNDQITHFMEFLNADPAEVNSAGGPREYLQRLGVTRIVATEAIYTTDDEYEDGDRLLNNAESVPEVVDHAIGAAINWLSKQDDDNEDVPLIPIIDILSDPDMAAKLIREAVTKLHASRTNASTRELANEVVNDLKDMASSDKDKWDMATPQIRKAISKLPDDMRPIAPGLSVEKPVFEQTLSKSSLRFINISDIEEQLADMVKPDSGSLLDEKDGEPIELKSLFDIRSEGMLSAWQDELKPVNILLSCARTYETLMAWQSNASEHGRIARALSLLVSRAVEIDDYDSSLLIAEGLIRESKVNDGIIWRRSNALAALESIDLNILQSIVKKTLKSGIYQHKEIASQIVESIPSLALSLVHLLGVYRGESFDESLKKGLVKEGRDSLPSLAIILRTGNPSSKMSALETLTDIASPPALKEISDSFGVLGELAIIKVLSLLSSVRSSYSIEICVKTLTHKLSDVKCAAIIALGAIGGESVIQHITRVITGRNFGSQEKVHAIQVLGNIGNHDHIVFLQKIADHRPMFGRSKYAAISSAAKDSITRIHHRLDAHPGK